MKVKPTQLIDLVRKGVRLIAQYFYILIAWVDNVNEKEP